MVRIDYGQVPRMDAPCRCKKWINRTIIFEPERIRDIFRDSEKWIDCKYLNSKKFFPEGSKALVGMRLSTGKWTVIKEAVRRAS